MIINFFLPSERQLDYKNDVEVYQNLIAFFIASWASIQSIYKIPCYLLFFKVFIVYLSLDSLFIPFKKKDIFFHHILIGILLLYGINIDDVFHKEVTTLIARTEISSIFLALTLLLSNFKKLRLSKLCQFCFIITFFKFRIQDLAIVLFKECRFIQISKEYLGNYYYSFSFFVFCFFMLNCFWGIKIIRYIKKKNFKKKTT